MKQKKFLASMTIVVMLFLFFSFHFALAYSSAGDGGSFDTPAGVSADITSFFENIMLSLQGIIAFFAIIFIVIGGILYMTSGGNQATATAAKICITSAIIGLALAGAGPSFLRQIKISIYGGVAVPIATNISLAPTLIQIADRVLTFLLSIAGILGIIGLTISGLLYIFASGDSSQATKAKEAVKYSVGGIAIAGASLIIVRQIVAFLT